MKRPIIAGIIVVALVIVGVWYLNQPKTIPSNKLTSLPMETNQPIIQSHRSFTFRSDAVTKNFQPNNPTSYIFSIVDDQGNTVKDFATTHERLMHVIVVRKDLAEFQHLHPEFNKITGQFTLGDLILPSHGQYRIFADFAPMSAQRGADGVPLGVTISEDVNVGALANYKAQPLTTSALTKSFQGYDVQLAADPAFIPAQEATMMSFAIKQNGKPVTNLEKYLGALGHSVVLSEGDLEFIHTHALDENVSNQNGTVDFHVVFPRAGTYKLFTQFQHRGRVITTDFVVSANESVNDGGQQSIIDPHSMH